MRNQLIFFLYLATLFLFPKHSQSQDKRDIGFQIGTTYYNGEFNENMPLYQPSPAFGVVFRYNYSRYYSIRASGAFGQVRGSFSGKEFMPNIATASFKKDVVNAEIMLEFNFIEFSPTTSNRHKFIAPYANAGVGGALIENKIYPVFPFSVGLKYTPGKRHTFALEWRFHKTFIDDIDNYETPNNSTKALVHNNDWFSFVGFIYTYRLYNHGQTCPVYK